MDNLKAAFHLSQILKLMYINATKGPLGLSFTVTRRIWIYIYKIYKGKFQFQKIRFWTFRPLPHILSLSRHMHGWFQCGLIQPARVMFMQFLKIKFIQLCQFTWYFICFTGKYFQNINQHLNIHSLKSSIHYPQLHSSIFCYFPEGSEILLPRHYFEVFRFHPERH